jgi:hypothetical protein
MIYLIDSFGNNWMLKPHTGGFLAYMESIDHRGMKFFEYRGLFKTLKDIGFIYE